MVSRLRRALPADCGERFKQPDGGVRFEMMPDGVHPSGAWVLSQRHGGSAGWARAAAPLPAAAPRAAAPALLPCAGAQGAEALLQCILEAVGS